MRGPSSRQTTLSTTESGQRLAAALEIGGTHAKAALVDLGDPERPAISAAHRTSLVASDSAAIVVAALVAAASTLDAPAGTPWGVALPGPFDYDRGVARYEGVGKFDALYGLDLHEALRQGIPGHPDEIVFLNDAQAFLRGEWLAGAARGCTRAVGLTLGTGIGSAFLADGALVVAGRLVPLCGSVHLLDFGGLPLEDVVSSRAISRRYAELASGAALEAREVADRARKGDRLAAAVFDQAFTALGCAVAPWLTRFAPSLVVLGGSIAQSWDLVAEPLQRGFKTASPVESPLPLVVPAKHPQNAALFGAGWSAIQRARQRPNDG